mmetsp:Transcript_30400/g.60737  ORF Transcript_30400/g.60737 Transcript_30400/m.60737 type:complete len:82 (+) Transcript_30400:618-863(+)
MWAHPFGRNAGSKEAERVNRPPPSVCFHVAGCAKFFVSTLGGNNSARTFPVSSHQHYVPANFCFQLPTGSNTTIHRFSILH